MTVDGKPVISGAPMGLPLTWSILDWLVDFCCRYADPKLRNYMHRGDDVIAWITEEQFRVLCWALEAAGFSINMTKTFKSKSRGTFCEKYYNLAKDGLHAIPTIPLRGLLEKQDEIVTLSQFSHECRDRGCDMARVWTLIKGFHEPLLTKAERQGVPLFVPSWMGGLGLVPRAPTHKVSKLVQSKFHGAVKHGVKGVQTKFNRVGPETKKALAQINKLEFATGVEPCRRCPHWQELIGLALSRPICRDGSVSELTNRSQTSILKEMSNRFWSIPQVYRSGDVTWKTIDKIEVYPTPKTLSKYLKHQCVFGIPSKEERLPRAGPS
jgi:hypothetical protein